MNYVRARCLSRCVYLWRSPDLIFFVSARCFKQNLFFIFAGWPRSQITHGSLIPSSIALSFTANNSFLGEARELDSETRAPDIDISWEITFLDVFSSWDYAAIIAGFDVRTTSLTFLQFFEWGWDIARKTWIWMTFFAQNKYTNIWLRMFFYPFFH